jgi:hypothetical protein
MNDADLRKRVMELYCPWYDAFTDNPDDTKQKLCYWEAVRVMDTKQLYEHIHAADTTSYIK